MKGSFDWGEMLDPIKIVGRERWQNIETCPLLFSVRIVGSGEHKTVIFCNAVFRRSVEPLMSPRVAPRTRA